MKLNPTVPHELIARQLLGRNTAAETLRLQEWIESDSANRALYNRLERDWALAHSSPKTVIPDPNVVWEQIQIKTGLLFKHQSTRAHRSLLVKVASIAAMVALVVGYALHWGVNEYMYEARTVVFRTEGGQRSQMVLPDGTQVWLNSNTRITYSSGYGTKNREVELDGEAYFDVNRSEKYPFTVNTGEVAVKVLGTKFNVKAHASSPLMSVSLVSGKVNLLETQHGKTLSTLLPNQQIVVDRQSLTCRTATCNAQNESLWHLNQLFFDDMPVDEMWKTLEGWYGVKFSIENMNKDKTYRFSLKTESLTELLKMINQLTPLEYTLNGEEVTLRYK